MSRLTGVGHRLTERTISGRVHEGGDDGESWTVTVSAESQVWGGPPLMVLQIEDTEGRVARIAVGRSAGEEIHELIGWAVATLR